MKNEAKLDVIVIEDDRLVCAGLVKTVAKDYVHGNIIGFSDIEEAIEYCLNQDIDTAIFIIDVFLGCMDGFYFFDSIKDKFQTAHFSTIMISGQEKNDIIQMCIHRDINYFLVKPIKPYMLWLAVRSIATIFLDFPKKLTGDMIFQSRIRQLFNLVDDSINTHPKNQITSKSANEYIIISREKINALQNIINNLDTNIKKLRQWYGSDDTIVDLSNIKHITEYCIIFTDLFANMFLKSEIILTIVDFNKLIDDVIAILNENISYQLCRNYLPCCYIQSDERQLKQLLFLLFKNINDYLYNENGYLKITTAKYIQKSKSKVSNNCFAEFQYGITETISKLSDKNLIMIVDDDINIIKYLVERFTLDDFEVISVTSGFECLDLINEINVDLIILDINMKGMNGIEVLKTIRRFRKYRHIPIILYSGFLLDDDVKNIEEEYAIYNPIRAMSKSENYPELLKLCVKLLQKDHSQFSLQNMLRLNLNDSITHDPILRMGLFPVAQIIKQINIEIKINDIGDKKSIIIFFKPLPKLTLKSSDNSEPNEKKLESANANTLQLLYDHYIHDLKNKLYLIYGDIQKLKSKYPGIVIAETLDSIIADIDECDRVV